MAYQENIPQPTDVQSDSQNDILNNFQTLNTAWEINHVAFDLPDQGKHNFVSLPRQSPSPAGVSGELQLYTRLSTFSAQTEMSIRRGAGLETEFTSALRATPGWTRLPSGILLKWGATTANGTTNILFPVAGTIPVFNNVFSVQLTVVDAGGTDADEAIRLVSFAAASFDIYASPRSTTGTKAVNFEYLVIGE